MYVQTLKSGLQKLKTGLIETKVSQFLFTYQVTPHGSTGVSPGELIFGCRMHTAMDISNTSCRILGMVKKLIRTLMIFMQGFPTQIPYSLNQTSLSNSHRTSGSAEQNSHCSQIFAAPRLLFEKHAARGHALQLVLGGRYTINT